MFLDVEAVKLISAASLKQKELQEYFDVILVWPIEEADYKLLFDSTKQIYTAETYSSKHKFSRSIPNKSQNTE